LLHADTDAGLAQVLTAVQMTEFERLRAAHLRSNGALRFQPASRACSGGVLLERHALVAVI
jgi:hypothetical protein